VWDSLTVEVLRAEGTSILRAHNKLVAGIIGSPPRRMLIAGHDVPAINCGANLASDVGHIFAKGEAFAATYLDTADYRIFSLRSSLDGMDVSEIAAAYGGGGHRNAAGFRIPLTDIECNSVIISYSGAPA